MINGHNASHPTFTFYHANGASRIDRIYVTPGLIALKSGIRIVPAAFIDHCAVELRIRIPNYSPPARRRFWTLYPTLLKDQEIQRKLKLAWEIWKRRRRFYPDVATWWELCVLRQSKSFTLREMAERRENYRNMENHLYACIYDILNGVASHVEKISNLNKYKAKLVRLHARKDEWILRDQAERGCI